MLFVCYPRCTTCKKAQKWLDDNGVPGQTYYVVSDVGATATMYAVYWGKRDNVNQWLYTDASYYQAPDGKTNTVFKVSDITDGKVTNEKEVNAFNDKHEEAETDEENFIYIHKYSIEN